MHSGIALPALEFVQFSLGFGPVPLSVSVLSVNLITSTSLNTQQSSNIHALMHSHE